MAALVMTFVAPRRAAAASPDMLVQVQAADVLSDLITMTAKRADTRVEALHKYLGQIGKEAAFDQAKPAAQQKALVPFSAVFQGAIAFVKQGGGKYADPSLATMSDADLSAELTELQVYNIQHFSHINEQYNAAQQMRAFLKSAGELEKYQQWAKENAIPTAPAPTTPDQVAAKMQTDIASARDMAWAKAEARGMTQAEFDARWGQQVKQYQDTVAQQVTGVKALAESLTAPPPPPTQIISPIVNTPVNRGSGADAAPPPLPAPVQSQYTAGMYQAANNALWNDTGNNNEW